MTCGFRQHHNQLAVGAMGTSEQSRPEMHDREQPKRKDTQEDHQQGVRPQTSGVSDRNAKPTQKKAPRVGENNVRKLRTERMISKAELARRAGLSTLTIDRVEKGFPCRMDTKRKILEALGLTPSDRVAVFGEDD